MDFPNLHQEEYKFTTHKNDSKKYNIYKYKKKYPFTCRLMIGCLSVMQTANKKCQALQKFFFKKKR